MSRSLIVIAALLLGSPLTIGVEAQSVVTFGVVIDGPSSYNTSFRTMLQNEIRDLLGGEFEILFSTIDGGGGLSTGGEFSLTDTIGHPDAVPGVLSGGEFSIDGGIWINAEKDDSIFRDGFEQVSK